MPACAATSRSVVDQADPLEAARAAVRQVLTTTADERTTILEAAYREQMQIVSKAEQEAAGIVDDARIRAGMILRAADASAAQTRGEAVCIIAEIRAALPSLLEVDKRLTELLVRVGRRERGAGDHEPALSAPDYGSVPDVTTQNGEGATARFDGFLDQLARQLDHLDRARSTGSRADLGLVLQNLSNLAEGADAPDLADYVRHLGPDARPEELDELIDRCYRVGYSTTNASTGSY